MLSRKLTDLFFTLRPVILIPVWGFSIFGYYRAADINPLKLQDSWFTISPLIYVAFLFFSLSVGVVYVMNQLADIDVDKKNGGLPLIASGIVSVKAAWILCGICTLLTIILPLFTPFKLLSLFSALTILIGYVYSFRPFFFSGRLIVDFLSNATGYGVIAFGVGWYLGGRELFSGEFLRASLPYFLLMCAGSINSTIPDISGDQAEGKNTTAVRLGASRSHLLSTSILIIAGAAAMIQKDLLASFCVILSLPVYFLYIIKPKNIFMEATYKVGGALCMMCAFLVMPVFIPISLCVFFCTRIYF
ncbi:MAG TPA: UbiA family prenyltransferase, partial [Chitinispirillaceae bacterium]|nr:UbiA family prenyltransferase [Chitinispirillaceae bacterium]